MMHPRVIVLKVYVAAAVICPGAMLAPASVILKAVMPIDLPPVPAGHLCLQCCLPFSIVVLHFRYTMAQRQAGVKQITVIL